MWNIAINTFREIIRNKYLYMIVFFAIIFIIFSLFLSELTIWDTNKIIIDFWIAMIEFFWIISVLFIWSQLLFKEIEWKTIFLILSKPIKRKDFIIWKFFGFSMAIFLIFIIKSIIFLSILFFKNIEITNIIIWSIVNTFLKFEIIMALVFFFSSFMGSLITIITAFLLYIVGNSYSIIMDIFTKSKDLFLIYFWKILNILIPPFEALNTKDLIWNFSNLTNIYLFSNLWISIIYIILLLIFTSLIFNKKDFQ